MYNPKNPPFFFCLFIGLLVTANSYATDKTNPNNTAKENASWDINASVTNALYEYASHQKASTPIASIDELLEKVSKSTFQETPEMVLGLIIENLSLIEANGNSVKACEIARVALQLQSLETATEIVKKIESRASKNVTARCEFEIANYYANNNLWDEALAHLKNIDLDNDLPTSTADNAYLILGAALQHEKKHRKALEYYQHIKPGSSSYPLALLNIALVDIRQDWWTDAQIAIQTAVAANNTEHIEFTNRLYTTLGFSQLQQGFYRNARESFRKVKLKSEYSKQALLGLGMAALNQEDFLGAFNAFDQLKKFADQSSPVEQSYLLAPLALGKLKQEKSAANAYAEAESFYTNRISDLSKITSMLNDENSVNWADINQKLDGLDTPDSVNSQAIAKKLKLLSGLLSSNSVPNSAPKIQQLYSQILATYVADSKSRISGKNQTLNNYLNQSRFGMTKLYDTP
jgi:tetratricopeptide (TPR) repeat protein